MSSEPAKGWNAKPEFQLGVDPKLAPLPKKTWLEKLVEAIAKLAGI